MLVLRQLGICLAILIAVTPPGRAGSIQPPASAAPEDDGQWAMPAKNFASTRYSELSEINQHNVGNLQVAFTFSTGIDRGQEASPLVVAGTMYVLTPYPNILYALDLTKPGAPVKWKYEPKPEAAAQGVACCDVVNRGPVFGDGRIYYNTLDGHTVAIDATTGEESWNVTLGDINIGETMTMAPLFAKGKIFVGNSGGEMGVRGWLQALDAASGKVVWKAWATGPDKDVLIGPDFHPFYKMDQGKDLGVTSWPPDAWQHGGGNSWGWISFDPDLNLIYYGTGNPGPWNADARPGDNKWTAGIFARDADSGSAKWFYQWSPHDLYDHDGINEQILLDMDWQGKPRKVLVRPERNGYVYVLDRTTGEVLSARPFAAVNSSTGVDLKTGRLQMNPDKAPVTGKVMRDICPAAPGAKDWNPSAFSPKTGYLYIPHSNLCMDLEGTEANYISGTPYVGAEVTMKAGPGDGHRGEFSAWDIARGKEVWTINERFPVWSGTLVTAGNVAFYGTIEGWFKAIDATSGKALWQFKTGSGIIGQPTTYRGPDGHQYVAILSGVGGWSGAIVAAELDRRDKTAALGFVGAMQDLPDATTKGGTLYVFRLP
ncbi:methanol/ethanol family PQQ-dependent dehydrogenase [Aquamicrobium soli]|uniref:Methanol/ethanol family PQQ-dependent dehydrogenase n=1 Tax=Aquamicrobium soli TaxID=1811518 RepID=A0ABV7K531_9HYPH